MKDGEIKGTGNSRYLKSNISQDTTIADIIEMLNVGTFPIDLNGINPDGWKTVPDWLSKLNLLSDSVCDLIGISRSSVPNDAFRVLAIPDGKAAVFITIRDSNGKRIPNIIVNGVTNRQGRSATTDSNGFVIGFTSSTSTTISVDTSYVNVSGYPKTISTPTGSINSAILTINLINEVTITSSQNVKFSPQVKSIDVHVSDGGYDSKANPGNAGKQGYARNKIISSNTNYPIVVGGRNGGKSSFLNVTGTLDGGSFDIYNPSKKNCTIKKYGYGTVVAGGAGANGAHQIFENYYHGELGGTPYGGNGGYSLTDNGGDATGYGGGGGQKGENGAIEGKGYQGVVFIKMNY